MRPKLKTTLITEIDPAAAPVKKLYEEAFPEKERVDFSLLLNCLKGGKAELFAYYCKDEPDCSYAANGEETTGCKNAFAGFAFVLLPESYAYLLFCAVEPSLRGRGLGTEMLDHLRRRYPDRTMVLDIVSPSDSAADNAERLRRSRFYAGNGFRDTGYEMRDESGDYRILSEQEVLNVPAFKESFSILPELFECTKIYKVSG